tara:strand:- start:1718 stop:1828 length:111 start_codon:yes stop_codon:yes gene_type:complete
MEEKRKESNGKELIQQTREGKRHSRVEQNRIDWNTI